MAAVPPLPPFTAIFPHRVACKGKNNMVSNDSKLPNSARNAIKKIYPKGVEPKIKLLVCRGTSHHM